MHLRKIVIVALFGWMIPMVSFSQSVTFKVIYNHSEIQLTGTNNKNGISVSNFKFYLSDFRFYQNDSLIDTEKFSYHLVDLLDTSRNSIIFKRNNHVTCNKIAFNLGIDSLTNVSGAMEGDLDPMYNMYWTWQSGYINLKFEGSIDDGVIREYHLGGYANPNNALQKVSLKINSSENVVVYIHLDDFIHSIPDSIPFKFMTPDPKAVYLSHLFAKCLSSEK